MQTSDNYNLHHIIMYATDLEHMYRTYSILFPKNMHLLYFSIMHIFGIIRCTLRLGSGKF